MDPDFITAQSDNLPKIDSMMMAEFFKDNADFSMAEFRGVKAERSRRESYGDNAIGQLRNIYMAQTHPPSFKKCPKTKVI